MSSPTASSLGVPYSAIKRTYTSSFSASPTDNGTVFICDIGTSETTDGNIIVTLPDKSLISEGYKVTLLYSNTAGYAFGIYVAFNDVNLGDQAILTRPGQEATAVFDGTEWRYFSTCRGEGNDAWLCGNSLEGGVTATTEGFVRILHSQTSAHNAFDTEDRTINSSDGLKTIDFENGDLAGGWTADNVPVARVHTTAPTVSADVTAKKGDLAVDTNFLYVCPVDGTWKRVALTSF